MSDFVPYKGEESDEREPVYLVQHTGPNRAERRASRAVLPDGSVVRVPKEFREEATNKPYVKDDRDS
jgi:hypothetical protein